MAQCGTRHITRASDADSATDASAASAECGHRTVSAHNAPESDHDTRTSTCRTSPRTTKTHAIAYVRDCWPERTSHCSHNVSTLHDDFKSKTRG
eukprot:3762764-Rhodomonas_salina.1